MKNIDSIKLNVNSSIKEALQIIDNGALQIALVVDKKNKLLGTVTDGDVRRGILKGVALSDSIEKIYFRNPTCAKVGETKESILNKALSKKVHQVPIIDNENRVVGIKEIEELIKSSKKLNRVILMVGGLGTRLRPLTEKTPKPMLKVGDKPILQTIIEKFAEYGYTNIILSVNYKSEIIRNYFGNGENFGVNIEYIFEDKRMGTAGALSLLKEKPEEAFFVMNGDILTNVNFEHLYQFHSENNSVATMCVREYDFQVPYGVVNIENEKIVSIEEKPVHSFFVSAGIYMLSPEVLQEIPENEFYDMPTLFEKLIKKKEIVSSFPLREYWLDIGRVEEYEKANEEYGKVL
jgi:dTDP-glucose pyrophosphorylase/predicted transcriptional regulator